MSRTWITALLLAPLAQWSPSARAQPGIAPPHLGFVEDSARTLRPAYGLAGNFVLGPSVAEKVVSAAFSGSIGLFKSDSFLTAFDAHGRELGSMGVDPGRALFAFSPGGNAALAYIVSNNAVVEWRGNAFLPLALNDEKATADEVIAIAFPNPYVASLFVQRNGTIWELNFPLGKVGIASRKAMIGVHAPLFALPGGLVYRDAGGMVVRRTDASEVHIAAALPATFSLQQMDRDWVQLTDLNGSARFAFHTTPGREGFYQLPESSQ
jgi:hypothetical protein